MIKPLFFLAFLLSCAIYPQLGLGQGAANPPVAPSAAGLTPGQAQQALDVLQDPQKRDRLIAVLQTIAKAAPVAEPADAAPAKPTVTLEPDSLGAQLLVAVSHWGTRLSGEAEATLRTMSDLPALWRWFVGLEADPRASLTLFMAAAWLGGISGCALLIELLGRWVLRRPRAALRSRLPAGNGERARLLRLLPYSLVGLGLDLVPIAAFSATGNLLAAIGPGIGTDTRLVVVAFINAYALCRAIMCVGRMLVSPDDGRLRLWRLDDAGARFVLRWLRRLVIVAIFGEALVEIALLLGLDQSAHDGLDRLVVLVLAAMLAVVVVRSRQPVGAYVRGDGRSRWRSWLAEAWPYLAVIAIVSFWIGTATGTRGGLSDLYFPGVTLAAVVGARLLTIVVLGTVERLLRLDGAEPIELPGLRPRIARYRLPLEYAATAIITGLCLVVVLQLWGVPAFAWFSGGGVGERLLSALVTIFVAMMIAIAVWELSQAALERHLADTGRGGPARSARLLTLLPLLRTALLAAIVVVIGLTALSQIGVNIAPLLAGAGIAGVAIGFGAQHLVQDVITGVFVLFENAINIGDGVTTAGLSGSVEQLSVRTIRLRAADGSVHIIPFSAVTTITNSNRGIGNVAVSVTVAYEEDPDRVCTVLSEIAAAMRTEDEYKPRILGDLQIFGVDQVKPSGVTISGQIVCTDTGRWPVQREFNRRLKRRFDAEKIKLAA
ncbi:MAG: mechanosensitive ion channel [Alphaproteobacteria bacterium]|nr:mechanosensitive ion channel [Alphaproteobacteria bacterium]